MDNTLSEIPCDFSSVCVTAPQQIDNQVNKSVAFRHQEFLTTLDLAQTLLSGYFGKLEKG